MPAKDLTAILVPSAQLTPDQIRNLIASRQYGDIYLRVAPLEKVGLTQIEVADGEKGLPCEDPDLVAALSQNGSATFVHVNHSAPQAMIHAFKNGKQADGVSTAPGPEFETRIRTALGASLEEIQAADDGSRIGVGIAATNTLALVRGRPILVMPGTPTGLGSFRFHDRGAGQKESTERMAFLAYDGSQVTGAYQQMPGRTLADRIEQMPAELFGPLNNARAEAVQRLRQFGEKSAQASDCKDARILELCAMATAVAFCGGDAVSYWNDRVLPMFNLSTTDPVIDKDDLDELKSASSIIDAMVRILPYGSPPGGEGSVLSMVGDDELRPLAPWAQVGEEYRGVIFRLKPTRLIEQVRRLDGDNLGKAIMRFEKAWYEIDIGKEPPADTLKNWRMAKQQTGQADMNRFATDWAELRALLEFATLNNLDVGLLFYDVA